MPLNIRDIDRSEAAAYRASMYALISRMFLLEPTEEELGLLIKTANAPRDLCLRASEETLLKRLSSLDGSNLQVLRSNVASEYVALFIGPKPPLSPIYESVYRGRARRLMDDTTMQVRRFYERFGRQVEQLNRVPDDHLGFETSFVADLCEREARADDALEAEKLRHGELEFIVCHLSCWAGDFAQSVANFAPGGFYRMWAEFLHDFIQEDEAYLSELVRPENRVA